MLKAHLAGKLPQAKAFNMPAKTADMIRADLEAAGIDWRDNGNGKLDFHALRHTFGTMLAASGGHPKTAQTLMRHSTIDLTMSRYTHTLTGQEAAAVNSLPDFSQANSEAQAKTGTDDEGTKTGQNHRATNRAISGAQQRSIADSGGKMGGKGNEHKGAQVLEKTGTCDTARVAELADAGDLKSPGRNLVRVRVPPRA